PIAWNAPIVRWRKGFHDPENAPLGAMNVSYGFIDPFAGFTRRFHSGMVPPKSTNVMPYINPEVDRLIEAAELAFDLSKQNALLARVHPTFKGGWSTAVNFVLLPPPDTKIGQYPPHDKRCDDSLGRRGLGGWAYCPRRSARASLA